MTGPYAQAAGDYWNAGWRGVLPLPARRKANPPDGTTGNEGIDPSFPDVMAWAEDFADGNIALRLPEGVLGLDIDNYDTKPGAASLEAAERAWGPLPATWRTTSRDDGVSGIRLYRVPRHADGGPLRWPGGFGPGTETIRRGHRYAVAPPSIHPEGRTYRWITPQGHVSLTPPRATELPWLPAAWVVGLTENRPAHSYQGAGMTDDDVKAWLEAHNHEPYDSCPVMQDAMGTALDEMESGAHEALRLLMRVVGLAAMGHPGLYQTLAELRSVFITTVAPRRDGGRDTAAQEWTRSLFGAVDKVVGEMAKTGTTTSRIDPCDVLVSPAEPEPTTSPMLELPAGDTVSDAEVEDTPELDDQVEAALNAEQQHALAVEKEFQQLAVREEARQRLQARDAPKHRWLTWQDLKNGPEPEPLVVGVLWRDSLSRMFGAAGSGKSFVAIDLALRVALGMDWGGNPVRQTNVAYVAAEGQRVNKWRFEAWQERHGVEDAKLEGKFFGVPDALMLTEVGVAEFVANIKREDVGLVILDTKNAMMVGEENSASDTAVMRRALDAIRKATDACVVLIDHTGKTNAEEARGSSAVKAAMDTEVRVDNDGQRPAKITVEVTRDKADEAGKTWEFMLRAHPLDEGKPAAVLLPLGDDIDLPATRELPSDVERRWLTAALPMPTTVLDYEGPGQAAVADLAKFMAHDAGVADPDGIGVTRVQAASALSVRRLGKTSGHSDAAVRRAWSALRGMGYLAPADGKDGSDGKAENTTGRHVWTARGGV